MTQILSPKSPIFRKKSLQLRLWFGTSTFNLIFKTKTSIHQTSLHAWSYTYMHEVTHPSITENLKQKSLSIEINCTTFAMRAKSHSSRIITLRPPCRADNLPKEHSDVFEKYIWLLNKKVFETRNYVFGAALETKCKPFSVSIHCNS